MTNLHSELDPITGIMPVLCGSGNWNHACVVCDMCGSRSFFDRETLCDEVRHTPYLRNGRKFCVQDARTSPARLLDGDPLQVAVF
jgi:hypothetical protein